MNKNYFSISRFSFSFTQKLSLLLFIGFICSLPVFANSITGSSVKTTTSKLTFAGGEVISFSLINANTKQVIRTISNGASLNLATLPAQSLNIRANTSPATIGSVKFALNGTQSYRQTESIAPYDLFGDDVIWTPAVGNYTLEATPYSASKGTGTTGITASINFKVINEAASTLVTSVKTTTGRNYVITELETGAALYTDRAYQVTGVPAFLEKAAFIRTANSDKTNKNTSAVTFSLSQAAKVYVAYDPRATALPAWLNGWQKLTDKLNINDSKISYLTLYTKSFPAGTVSLGGTLASPAAGALNNYVVLANPAVAKSNAYLVLENPDKFPANDELTFSNIKYLWRRKTGTNTYTPYNRDHNRIKLKVSNKGTGSLIISKLMLSNTAAWKIDSINDKAYSAATALPLTINSGASAELNIRFSAANAGTAVILHNDKLTITSNDAGNPNKEVALRGLWQFKGEGVNEPNAQQIITSFGFRTRTGYGHNDGAIDGSTLVPNSDEVAADHFVRADASKPVSVVQMGAYHGCCAQSEKFQWYDKATTAIKTLFYHSSLDGQSLLPRKAGSTVTASGTFSPTAPFGLLVESSYSNRTRNFKDKLGMRVWKAIDANGNLIPNAYIVGTDYLGTPFTNYDYQDNVYFISNIRPETGSANYSELAAVPSAATFGSVIAGNSGSTTVKLINQGKKYSNGSSDPAIQIKRIELVGPNKSEFSVIYSADKALTPQGTTNVTVGFSPKSRGLKNAALLVSYNTSAAPLRIPLYGIADNGSSRIAIVKRIKGGSDVNVTINGNAWESDKNYRKGSVRLDKQVITGPIAGTDNDVLYQTYLSATTNLAQTRLEVPAANGIYQVRLHFVENFFDAENARIFNISLENQLRLSNFDIYREVGYRAALVKDFEVTVTDGLLNMNFAPTANRLALAGAEIYKVTPKATVTSAKVATALEQVMPVEGMPEMLIYPNPSTGDQVKIALKNFAKQEQVTLNILDVVGRVLETRTVITDAEGMVTIEIAAAHLQNGLYIIRANASSGKAQSKLLIEK